MIIHSFYSITIIELYLLTHSSLNSERTHVLAGKLQLLRSVKLIETHRILKNTKNSHNIKQNESFIDVCKKFIRKVTGETQVVK